jgi:ribonuclease P protein component
MRASLPKKDVSSLMRERPAFKTRHFVLKVARRHHGRPRVAFAFSRGVGPAVLRNRFKRRWREWVRLHTATLRGCDVLVLARGGLGEITDAEWRVEKERLEVMIGENAMKI